MYYVKGREYEVHMDVQQEIHFNLLAALNEAGVSIAYPVVENRIKMETPVTIAK